MPVKVEELNGMEADTNLQKVRDYLKQNKGDAFKTEEIQKVCNLSSHAYAWKVLNTLVLRNLIKNRQVGRTMYWFYD